MYENLRRGKNKNNGSKRSLGDESKSSPAFDASLLVSGFTAAALDLKPCILVRTYKGNRNGLTLLLWSLLASGHPHLRAVVVDTDPEPLPGLGEIIGSINALSGRSWVGMSPRTHAQDVQGKFPSLDTPDFGYVLTDLVMEDILRGNDGPTGGVPTADDPLRAGVPTPSCDTLTVTNGDNMYAQEFLVRTLNKIAEGADAVGTNWVSHYHIDAPRKTNAPYDGNWCGSYRRGAYQEMKVKFQCYCIDLGAAVFRVNTVSKSGLRFCVDRLRSKEKIDRLDLSDGQFFERLGKLANVSVAVLHEALFLHN